MTSSARVRAGGALDVTKPNVARAVLAHATDPNALSAIADDVPADRALEALASEAMAADIAIEIRARVRDRAPHPPVTDAEARRMLKPHFERRDVGGAVDALMSLSDSSQRLVRALLTLTGGDAKTIVSLVRRNEYDRAASVAGRHLQGLGADVRRSTMEESRASWPRLFATSV